MNRHLLLLAAIHAEDPGALDAVFGPDGDFEGAPMWHPQLLVDGAYRQAWASWDSDGRVASIMVLMPCFKGVEAAPIRWDVAYLDLRIPSVAARLAGLLLVAGFTAQSAPDAILLEDALVSASAPQKWTEQQASRLAALVLAGADKIASVQKGSNR